ncbi:MAG: heparinase [Lachnospiraceae bacterium]
MENSFQIQYKNQVKALADNMRKEPLPKLTEELFAQFETTGNRLNYEAVYFRRRKFLAVYGMAAYLLKRQEDVKKLSEVLTEICAEECWALPAHVNRKEEKEWKHTVDLFASETAQALSEIITLVNEELPADSRLPEALCETVREEIEKRVLKPFFQSKPNYGCWECADHNWNAVCTGSIGSACIYLMAGKEEERLRECLKRICHSLKFYLDGFKEDGTCMEGIAYFTYGMTYFTGFAEQLLRYSKGAVNLFENEKLKKIACFQQKLYFQSGRTVSFSDGEQAAKFRMGLTCFLAKQYEEVILPDKELAADFESDSCYRFMALMRDYLWTKDMPERDSERAASRHDVLPDAQWSICESSAGCAMAIKGGSNDEPHNHNDVGSFFYLVGDEFLLTDLGAGEYTKDYFGKGRYDILCNSSLGHSVPLIDGKLQQAGAAYRASEFSTDGKGTTRVEFSGAYPEGCANRFFRETRFSLKTGVLTVVDTYDLPKETRTLTEQLVTQGKVTIEEHRVRITGRKQECVVQLPEDVKQIRCQETEHRNHSGGLEFVRLIQWEMPLQQGKENRGITRFTVNAYEI